MIMIAYPIMSAVIAGNNTPPQATNATNATNPSPRGADNKPVAVQTNSNSLRVTANQNNGFIARTPTATSIRRRSTHRHHKSSRKRSTDRTTRLLIVILVLFLLTEFPQASFLCKFSSQESIILRFAKLFCFAYFFVVQSS